MSQKSNVCFWKCCIFWWKYGWYNLCIPKTVFHMYKSDLRPGIRLIPFSKWNMFSTILSVLRCQNDLNCHYFYPSFNIHWEKAKTVCQIHKKSACRVYRCVGHLQISPNNSMSTCKSYCSLFLLFFNKYWSFD